VWFIFFIIIIWCSTPTYQFSIVIPWQKMTFRVSSSLIKKLVKSSLTTKNVHNLHVQLLYNIHFRGCENFFFQITRQHLFLKLLHFSYFMFVFSGNLRPNQSVEKQKLFIHFRWFSFTFQPEDKDCQFIPLAATILKLTIKYLKEDILQSLSTH